MKRKKRYNMVRRLAGASCLVLFIPRFDALPNESMDRVLLFVERKKRSSFLRKCH